MLTTNDDLILGVPRSVDIHSDWYLQKCLNLALHQAKQHCGGVNIQNTDTMPYTTSDEYISVGNMAVWEHITTFDPAHGKHPINHCLMLIRWRIQDYRRESATWFGWDRKSKKWKSRLSVPVAPVDFEPGEWAQPTPEPVDCGESHGVEVERRLTLERLVSLLYPLPWQRAVRLHLAGKPQTEIAVLLGVRPSRVSQILSLATERLKELAKCTPTDISERRSKYYSFNATINNSL